MARPRYACGIELSSQGAGIGFLDVSSGDFTPFSFSYQDVFGDRYPIDGGVIRMGNEAIHVPQTMLLEAQDRLFEMAPKEFIENTIRYKADCMQHNETFTKRVDAGLNRMDPSKTIADNISPYFSRETTPIWEDRSTGKEVEYLNEQLEKHGGMSALTANRTEKRFPAAQLIKWISERPEEYGNTSEIRALSAFVTSILAGKLVGTDTGDGWGTNLNTMNINNPGYQTLITDLIDKDLHKKLGKMVHYDTRMGKISEYIVERFGANPEAYVLAGTGDNPSYLLGFFLSAGTSWTLNGELPEVVQTNGEDNIFGCKPGGVMSLVCFSNGGRIHEKFKDLYAGGSWGKYRKIAMENNTPGKRLMLPYLSEESVPDRKAGIVRDGFDDSDATANIQALYASQVLAARLHSQHMRIPDTIWVVAGGGKDPALRQTVADVFGCNTKTMEKKYSDHAAVFGNCMAGAADFLDMSYNEALRTFAREQPNSLATPRPKHVEAFKEALERYEQLEKKSA